MAEIKTRQSGIELLRIFTMFGVIFIHYSHQAFLHMEGLGANKMVLYFLYSLSICAVDLFILISGYFLSGTGRRGFGKLLELLVQVMLFSEAFYLLAMIPHPEAFTWTEFWKRLLPDNYFVTLYIALYIISPYLNRIFQGFDTKKWNRFMGTVLLLFSVWPTLVDFMEEVFGAEGQGISTVGIWGSQQGYTIVNFALLYLVGAYLRHCPLPKPLERKKNRLFVLIVSVGVIFGWSLLTENFIRFEQRSAWVYHNPLVILVAAILFSLFREMKWESRGVNELARASFICFLVHAEVLRFMKIENFVGGSIWVMLLHVAVSILASYLISYIVYKIYTWVTRPFWKKICELKPFSPREIP